MTVKFVKLSYPSVGSILTPPPAGLPFDSTINTRAYAVAFNPNVSVITAWIDDKSGNFVT